MIPVRVTGRTLFSRPRERYSTLSRKARARSDLGVEKNTSGGASSISTPSSRKHGALKGIGFSVGKDTVIDYITYAKEAYLLFSVQNGFYAFSDRESTPKYYFTDNGLLNLFLFDKNSVLLENLIAAGMDNFGWSRRKSSAIWLGMDFSWVM